MILYSLWAAIRLEPRKAMLVVYILFLSIATLAVLFLIGCADASNAGPPPTPSMPVSQVERDALTALVRSAGDGPASGLEPQDPGYVEAMNAYYAAYEEYLNAWRKRNWQLAAADPKAYAQAIEKISETWAAEYWRQYQYDVSAGETGNPS